MFRGAESQGEVEGGAKPPAAEGSPKKINNAWQLNGNILLKKGNSSLPVTNRLSCKVKRTVSNLVLGKISSFHFTSVCTFPEGDASSVHPFIILSPQCFIRSSVHHFCRLSASSVHPFINSVLHPFIIFASSVHHFSSSFLGFENRYR